MGEGEAQAIGGESGFTLHNAISGPVLPNTGSAAGSGTRAMRSSAAGRSSGRPVFMSQRWPSG